MKRLLLVAYDYGQGAVWAYVLAESRDAIAQGFPELQVVDEPPSWMTDDHRRRLEARMEDIDQPGSGLLGDILKNRAEE
jgi:hypothetical protein